MDDPAFLTANNAAARIAVTARSHPTSPSVNLAHSIPAAEAAAINPVTTETTQWTRLRTTTRRQITNTCTQFTAAIKRGDSRGSVRALVEYAQELLHEARDVNNRLLEGAEPEEFDRQHEAHTKYVQQVKVVEAELQRYLATRAHLPPSVKGLPTLELRNYPSRECNQSRYQLSVHSSQHSLSDPQEADRSQRQIEAQQRSTEAQLDLQEAERALQLLQVEENEDRRSLPEFYNHDGVNRWCQNHSPWGIEGEAQLQDEAPDDWIDMYSVGRLRPATRTEAGSHSSVRAELPDFSGRSLEWFAWVDLFRALVHDTSKAAGEKFAILKRHLRGDCLDVVYGLGGGEAAYIQALVRLKANFGRRDVMRAAHLQALDKLEIQKNDPASFKRYAEKVRTHLFDLTRIGEAGTSDIIEKICLKLQLSDRLAWNSDRGNGLERRNLNQFGTWICARAAAYQNAYSIAADQLNGGTSKSKDRQYTRNNQTSAEARDREPRIPSSAYCFKCEGSHKLDDCHSFKDLTIKDKLSFCIRHRLCFNCLRSRHSARECRSKKGCSIPNCKRTHHILLHDQSQDESVRPVTARASLSKGKKTAVGMIRLDVLDAEGNIVKANAFLDEGSDAAPFSETDSFLDYE
ncbi:uncharacterized protein LOC130698707 [Daphnia carinata]|uniref:uncharacterized protein LOC130698707 n=1 Tax=Daphnia carinata TaxID=120202 RepID=UPI00257D02F6|nr:uncharacterized protein LOC130698707 [Daphnia carinata]